jgi:hypothetical protein
MKKLVVALMFALTFAPLQAQNKPIITVLDFSTDGVSNSEMRTIVSLLSSALFQTQRFTVIDVSERDRLLKELEFSVAECSDESCQLEIGRLLAAEQIVVGNLGKVGSRYILSAKMLETETARTLSTADGVYDDLDALVDDLFALAGKLSGAPTEGTATTGKAAKAPKPAKPAKEKTPRPPRELPLAGGNYFTLTTAVGANLPVGPVSEALGLGVPALVSFDYILDRSRGALGLGAVSGLQYQGTNPEARFLYTMLSLPLGLSTSYRLKFPSPFYLTAGADGGMMVNVILYKETYPDRSNLVEISPFAAATVGGGYVLSPKLSLEFDANLVVVFFTDAVYLGIAPTLGARFRL